MRFKEAGISHSEFLAEDYSPEEPNRWVNLALGEDTVEQVQELIQSIIKKYEATF